MITVTFYYREQCPECEQALADLNALQETFPHRLVTVNVDHNRDLQEKLGVQLPVIEIGPYHLRPPFTGQDMQIMLSAARDRIGQLEQVDQEAYQQRLDKGHSLSSDDKVSYFISHHYLNCINAVTGN